MLLTTILTKKYTIAEILKNTALSTLTPLAIYIMHLQNTQLLALNTSIVRAEKNSVEIADKLQALSEEVSNLKKINIEQKAHINALQNKIHTDFIQQDHNLVAVQNEMTQFYIKTAGYVVAAVLIAGVVYYVSASTHSWFSVKGVLPESTYKFLQRNTPFFQERAEYQHYDKATETSWIVNIINNEDVDLKVKPKDEHDFMSLYDWTRTLHDRWEASVEKTSTKAVETILDSTPTDISSIPSGATLDIVTSSVTIDAQAAQVTADIAEHISKFF